MAPAVAKIFFRCVCCVKTCFELFWVGIFLRERLINSAPLQPKFFVSTSSILVGRFDIRLIKKCHIVPRKPIIKRTISTLFSCAPPSGKNTSLSRSLSVVVATNERDYRHPPPITSTTGTALARTDHLLSRRI